MTHHDEPATTGPFLPNPDHTEILICLSTGAKLAVLAGTRDDLETIGAWATARGLLPELLAVLAYAPMAHQVMVRVGELALVGENAPDGIAQTMREVSEQVAAELGMLTPPKGFDPQTGRARQERTA